MPTEQGFSVLTNGGLVGMDPDSPMDTVAMSQTRSVVLEADSRCCHGPGPTFAYTATLRLLYPDCRKLISLTSQISSAVALHCCGFSATWKM